jgi:hypothetical protein
MQVWLKGSLALTLSGYVAPESGVVSLSVRKTAEGGIIPYYERNVSRCISILVHSQQTDTHRQPFEPTPVRWINPNQVEFAQLSPV